MTSPSSQIIPVGMCQCGCGQLAPIAKRTRRDLGHVRGQPVSRIRSHNSTQVRTDFTDAQPFKIDGDYCKLIQLTKGHFHVVDADEYERVRKIVWTVSWSWTVQSFYGYNTRVGKLHRYILGLAKGDPRTGDHKDPSRTWDNRRRNLRIANDNQQVWNQRLRKDNKSGFKGVSWHRTMKQYRAAIRANGVCRVLGYDPDPAICGEMYRVAAEALHGEFARTA
jgi:hypothetical protein